MCARLDVVGNSADEMHGLIVFFDRRGRPQKGSPEGDRTDVLTHNGDDGLISDPAFILDFRMHMLAVQAAGFNRKEATRLFQELLGTPRLQLAPIAAPDVKEIYRDIQDVSSVEVYLAGPPAGNTTVAKGIRSAQTEVGAIRTKLVFEGAPTEKLHWKIMRGFLDDQLDISSQQGKKKKRVRKLLVRGIIPKDDQQKEIVLDMLSGIIDDTVELPNDIPTGSEARIRLIEQALERHWNRIHKALGGRNW